MSAVTLLCADRPLPLYESGVRRVETSSHGGYTVRIEASGFSVGEHTYYREAVEDLCLTMKPCRYELDLRATQEDAAEPFNQWVLWNGDGTQDFICIEPMSGAVNALNSGVGLVQLQPGEAKTYTVRLYPWLP